MNKQTLQTKMLRHGEILLIPVTAVPEGFEKTFTGKEYIVGHSESGHFHVAVAEDTKGLTVYTPIGADSQDLYLKVSAPSKVEHKKSFDKHKDIDLPEGMYLVRPKAEFDPFLKLLTRVRD